jgi:hypothetical protein
MEIFSAPLEELERSVSFALSWVEAANKLPRKVRWPDISSLVEKVQHLVHRVKGLHLSLNNRLVGRLLFGLPF